MALAQVSENQDGLIAEIAPAMRKKLEADGLQRGVMTSNALIIMALLISQLARESDSAYSTTVAFTALGVAVLALAVLPFYLKKRSVSAEVHYRRKNGKWRWER